MVVLVAVQPIASTSPLRAQAITKRFAAPPDENLEKSESGDLQHRSTIVHSRIIDSTFTVRLAARRPLAASAVNAGNSDGWKTARITTYAIGAVVAGVLVFALIAIRAD